ncbi:MAG: tRNA uridine-5-carboxymethylaminomethyl(34) synthesis GTPase MnmE, partial [Thiovulaceae bacterium]|nr:tRNA uridine-5-carboxymethylaminomethyl(34) synthesis GTPase MnmE [Sulfurimonadaceae bacterium]
MITTTTDTIAAVATANGIGSIAIIRISGEEALNIAKKLTHKEDFTPRYASLTNIYNKENELI